MKEECSGCKQMTYLVNRRHKMCERCNHQRKHGEPLEVTQQRKQLEYQKRAQEKALSRPPKPVTPTHIREISKKRQPGEDKYSQVIKEIALEREPVCEGCGRGQGGEIALSNSHIISRKRCMEIGKPELIYHKQNIRLHCLDFMGHEGCHRKWEGNDKPFLLDFWENMEFIKEHDPQWHRKLSVQFDLED